ncbi:MATE family efflux transporter [Treponema brennaborense]|uniref:MATE efflux family protein n=1 Tax=Treponema brennaborense (strain DSM 12168 / CIP 105900 / DD5/3) TaxID=906968 RepID=F4LQ66_TREBD|nr:MATE family efflux transporter [Treponema brennaborense]AEE16087.1 MATE efflux family protein [Treponema brennaborense DSM 12168]
MKYTIDAKESQRRTDILCGNQWRVIFAVALPLVFYNSLSQIFQFADTLIAAHLSADVVSTVSFISQIQTMLAAIGSGLALGGGIIIARCYGAGDMDEVRKQISTLFFLAIIGGGAVLALIVPFAYPLLALLRMPEDLIAGGTAYLIIEVSGLISVFVNTIYFAIEKSRGNTKAIMVYNTLVLVLKTLLNVVFIYGFKGGMLLLPTATLIANSVVTAAAVRRLRSKKNPFRISFRLCSFKRSTILPILKLSVPVFLEKFVFAFGKVIVNSMSASYGSLTVGALGVSNRIGGLATNPPTGFQEAEATLISQNLGNRNIDRALQIFRKTFCINMLFACVCFILMSVFQTPLVQLFAKGDPAFAEQIRKIYRYERYASILIAASTSVMGLLYGFGYTKISMTLNIVRLFVYRIPPLWILMKWTALDSEAVGIAMLISNGLIGITATAVSIVLVRRIRRQHGGRAITDGFGRKTRSVCG